MALDIHCRSNLPDVANMSGKYTGVQARQAQVENVCVHLVTQKARTTAKTVKSALHWGHQLKTLCGLSGKYKEMFHQIVTTNHGISTAPKPLCQ